LKSINEAGPNIPTAPMILDLNDPDLQRRLIIGLRGDPDQPPPRFRGGAISKPTRKRKPTLAGVARQAAKAGIAVAAYEVRPDGTIGIITGKPDDRSDTVAGDWDRLQ
jgi:hypothetical protein